LQVFLEKSRLLDQFQIPEFVLKTQQQISKDFAIVGATFPDHFAEEELDYPLILNEVQNQLIHVMKFGETTLLQLLYQIDLPQQDFLSLVSDSDFTEKLSDLIIRREAYKVYLRTKF